MNQLKAILLIPVFLFLSVSASFGCCLNDISSCCSGHLNQNNKHKGHLKQKSYKKSHLKSNIKQIKQADDCHKHSVTPTPTNLKEKTKFISFHNYFCSCHKTVPIINYLSFTFNENLKVKYIKQVILFTNTSKQAALINLHKSLYESKSKLSYKNKQVAIFLLKQSFLI